MPAEVIDGRRIAAGMYADLKTRIAGLARAGIRPGFAAVVVGDDPFEHRHARRKVRACEQIEMYGQAVILPARCSESDTLLAVERLNDDRRVHGVLIQLPLPPHINADAVLRHVVPPKDVDGYHPLNEGRVAARAGGLPRAAALAIQQMLVRSGFVVRGAHAVVLGHSNAIARPVATLLTHEGPGGGAVVTLCPEWAQDVPAVTRAAHVLIAAGIRPAFVSREMVAPGAIVIDAGAHRTAQPDRPDAYRTAGDVRFDEVRTVARAISPVPGGVGPVTVAALLHNTVQAAESCLRN